VKFGAIPLTEAEGTVLAHTQRLPDRVLRKGSVLDRAAVEALLATHRETVIAARLEPGDVGEDECARRLGEVLVGPHVALSRAATGRTNLVAEKAGLLRVNAALIDRLNGIDEAITIATLPDYATVAPRDLLATIKIIPFAVPEDRLAQAERIAREAPAVILHPFQPRRVGLVLTELPGLKESVTASTIAATAARIAGLGGKLLPPLRCPHEQSATAACLRRLLDDGAEILLVAGASAVVDRRDVGPAAVVQAGGEIVHFGMPVDPGNLICVGRIGAVPALVLPGCARSPKANGIDWVLSRLAAGLDVGGAEVMRMGVGGLLKEIDVRPLPRAKSSHLAAPREPALVAAVVLSAGRSSRMAPHNKLLLPDRSGKPMIARVVDNILSSRARPVIVVLGHRAEEVRAALAARPVTFVHAPDYAAGLSASLRAGIAGVPDTAAAAVVCLGDMPLVTGRMIDRLIDAYDRDEGRLLVVPTHRGRQGNPILWDQRFFAEMRALSGDSGARFLLARYMELMAEVEMDEDGVLRDFDTVESLSTLPPRLRPPE
jgi:molybdenum cofactor cytidylyltransferase